MRLKELAEENPGFEVLRLPGARRGSRYEVVHRGSGLRTACLLPTLASCEWAITSFERDRECRQYWR